MKKNPSNKLILSISAGLITATILTACGGGGSSSSSNGTGNQTPTGIASIAITDAPGLEYDHVYITLKEVWFHQSDSVSPTDSKWVKFPLSTPVTIDLAQLTNGALSTVFSNLALPLGAYKQIKLILAGTNEALEASAQALGLKANNEIVYNGIANLPLQVADAKNGISLLGNFTLSQVKPLDLVVDFDIGHDIIANTRSFTQEFVLKPRLHYFDLSNSGAIIGKIDPSVIQSSTNPSGGYNFVIKAEQLSNDGTYHTVSRSTTIKSDGTFVLYPLAANPDGSTKSYDILIRGRNIESYLIKGVPVISGTTPINNPTSLVKTSISTALGSEYAVNLSPAANPTGEWINFYQTLPGQGEVPYEIRFRHVNPFTGTFSNDIDLSTGNIHVGTYNAGSDITFTSVNPQENAGNFGAVGDAPYFDRSTFTPVTSSGNGTTTLSVDNLNVTAPQVADSISGTLTVPANFAGHLDKGNLLILRNGLIVTSQNIDSLLVGNGGSFTINNIPGGSTTTTIPGAYYTAYVRAWNSADKAIRANGSVASPIDLTQGSATGVAINLK